MNRALTTRLLVAASSLLLPLVLLAAPDPVEASTGDVPMAATVHASTDDTTDDTTRPTVNEFLPEARPLGDCLGSLPKPDCGSEARGGWAQTAVFLAIIAGLAFIAWRVVAGARRARRETDGSITPGTRDATTVPDGDGGDPAP
jgi:hypothetical protein